MSVKSKGNVSLKLFRELVNGSGLPGVSVFGSLADHALEKRKNAALAILSEEIAAGRHDGVNFEEGDAEEAALMFMRFIKASASGAAMKNLRLLARVIIGLKKIELLSLINFICGPTS